MNIGMTNSLVKLVFDIYDSIPSKYKPKKGEEYTVLAAFIATSKSRCDFSDVISVATGTKCIGLDQSMNDIDGYFMNDSHAEVLAKRGFRRYLFSLLQSLPNSKRNDIFEWNGSSKLLRLNDDISISLFISDQPCGDSSIYSCNNGQNQFTGAKLITTDSHWILESDDQLLGCLRTKSGRSDLPLSHRTLSKSCIDKICKWAVLGLQGSVLSNYFEPVYISKVIICRDPLTASGANQTAAFHRAVTNRITKSKSGQIVRSPEVEVVDLHSVEFAAVKLPAEVGKAHSNYLLSISNQRSKRGADDGSKWSLEDTRKEHLDTGAESVICPETKKQKINGDASLSCSNDSNKLRPCAVSFNWVRDVSHHTHSGQLPLSLPLASHKHLEESVCGGSLELTQAHNGILQGATKKNIHRGICSSRLCRRNMALLCDQVASTVPVRLPLPTSSDSTDIIISDADGSDPTADQLANLVDNEIGPDTAKKVTMTCRHEESSSMSVSRPASTRFVYADWKNDRRNATYVAGLSLFKQIATFESWDRDATITSDISSSTH